ncbi:YlxR domain-containing protein, partial [Dysosmobacter welbionis]
QHLRGTHHTGPGYSGGSQGHGQYGDTGAVSGEAAHGRRSHPGGRAEHGGHDHLRGWHCLLCGGRWPGRGRLPGNHHLRSGHDGGGQHPDRPAGH